MSYRLCLYLEKMSLGMAFECLFLSYITCMAVLHSQRHSKHHMQMDCDKSLSTNQYWRDTALRIHSRTCAVHMRPCNVFVVLRRARNSRAIIIIIMYITIVRKWQRRVLLLPVISNPNFIRSGPN